MLDALKYAKIAEYLYYSALFLDRPQASGLFTAAVQRSIAGGNSPSRKVMNNVSRHQRQFFFPIFAHLPFFFSPDRLKAMLPGASIWPIWPGVT